MEGFNQPQDIELDNSGNIYVADTQNHRIQIYDDQKNLIDTIGNGSASSEPGELNMPWGIDIDSDGLIYVADYFNDRIQVFTGSGDYSYSICDGIWKPKRVKVHKNKFMSVIVIIT
ncbi:MAG: hypothetical protein OMM_14623 [Candidatus Magnetoglobus multicellularis str. Araruama]|uniref:NHL repeat containing protein n=1 Tax=Candidatus Magnetoglobus multicellularis str. Araruama TaxID=890399 RepID=A0A1V1NRL9_9BACT|nr:MAG: hypothetical protein OMM_14623 [Candidatus Magnetoglobus multicellularis str. Araruama]